ncbi:viral A-type inclusion protein [Clostridium butyricum]
MAIFDLKANIDLKQNLNLYTTCKQLDSLNLILSVFDNSVQTNLTNYNVRLKAMKADKVPLVQEHTGISISGNVITIETDEQLTTTSGKTLIELQFIDKGTGKKKATFNLVLIVVPSVLEVDRSISKATYTLLEELENKLDQASDFFENIEDAIVANNNLKKTISNSETAESNLETAITNANNKKNEVDEAITIATNKIEEVEQSIINANNSKTELDASKTIADTTKIDLDNANVQAEKNIEELNKLGDATDLAAKVQTNTENISKNNKSIEEVNSHLNDITNSGYFDIAKDMKGADYKTIKENGFYRNVTGTPTTGTGGVLLVISNTDKWSVAYKWLSISNAVITEYNACKDGDNYEEWKEISTNDTGWLTLPLSSGVVVDSGLTPQYRKIGNRVFIRGSVKNIVSGNSVIGTLPVGFRPVLQNHHYATFTNTNACASFNISTDGRIIYQGNSTNTFNAEWFVVITNNFII